MRKLVLSVLVTGAALASAAVSAEELAGTLKKINDSGV
ncbi:glutamate/aspartate ABC transporter substrate-binding protein, partial [Salmonella enterica subsp. enterica]|nr:glutamate/aspartate ABC transporter substrate-binding protein [Salmonella enterica subsp. enterica serovar Typhimurium]